MKKLVNGKLIEMTPEETAAMEREQRTQALMERERPLSESEVLALLIPELDQECRDALKRWAVGKKKKD